MLIGPEKAESRLFRQKRPSPLVRDEQKFVSGQKLRLRRAKAGV